MKTTTSMLDERELVAGHGGGSEDEVHGLVKERPKDSSRPALLICGYGVPWPLLGDSPDFCSACSACSPVRRGSPS